jgi:hypothetical protein
MLLRHAELQVRGPCSWLRRLVLIAFAALTCGAAIGWAAPAPPRTDDPPPSPGGRGQEAFWQVVQNPLLPAGASLGALWTDDSGGLYVWGIEPAVPLPNGSPQRSVLYHWDGSSWSVVMDVSGETGVSIHGTKSDDIFAATSTIDGAAKMYHYDGVAWTEQALPEGTAAPAGVIAGTLDDIYFRSAFDVLRYDGSRWGRVYTSDDDMANALAYVGPSEVYANCCTGHCCWDGTSWCHHDCGTFGNVGASWGMRQFDHAPANIPQPSPRTLWMYAAGRSAADGSFAVWRFVEALPGTMAGQWELVLIDSQPAAAPMSTDAVYRTTPDDPPGGPSALDGAGVAVWGSSGWDIYAAGTLSGVGLLYHFDGESWTKLAPVENMPPIADVWGVGPGDVWVSLTDGRLLHYTGGIMNPNPVSSVRRPEAALPGTPSPVLAKAGAPGTLAARVVRGGSGVVTIEYSVPGDGQVSIAAFDITGRRLALIESAERKSGTYQVDWNTAGLARGVYYYQMKAGSRALSGRVVVLD